MLGRFGYVCAGRQGLGRLLSDHGLSLKTSGLEGVRLSLHVGVWDDALGKPRTEMPNLRPTTPISHRIDRLNFPIPTKLQEPKKV